MFDIGFMELVLIGIVALLVVGPEKLPGAIRTGALWVGRAKRSFNQVKTDIEREINADEIRRQLHNESILADIEKAKKGADKLISDTRKDLDSLNADVNSTLSGQKKELEAVLQDPAPKSAAATQPEAIVDEPAEIADAASQPEAPPVETPPAETPQPALKPVEDFYNNPPSGIIRLQGGEFQQVVDEEVSDQEPQRKS